MACFFRTSAQVNLVPNPSFELYSSCPVMPTQIYLATGWSAPTVGGTSDYFNSCANSSYIGVPTNFYGHQNARTGDGYSGFGTYHSSNLREYIQAKLDTVLKPTHRYCVELYVSLADSELLSCNSLGVFFSDTAVSGQNTFPLPFIPQVNNNTVSNPLTDKNAWMKITGSFEAIGGENYITIGNFYYNNLSDTTQLIGGIYNEAYYYIDDISVVDCTYDGIDEISGDKMHFKSYPNPNNGSMVLVYKIGDNETGVINIYDITGKMIKSNIFNSTNSSLSIDASNLEAGMYYYEINVDGNKMKTDKLIIIK